MEVNPRKLQIQGIVTITNGNKIIVEKLNNKFVRNGLRHLASYLLCAYVGHMGWGGWTAWGSYSPNILFGKNNTPTLFTHDDLLSTISLSPIGIGGTGIIASSDGSYVKHTFTATWSAGTLNTFLSGSESIGEVGLFLNSFTNLSPGWSYVSKQNVNYTYPSALFCRIGLEDDAFVPDTSNPVGIEWEIGVSFV
jgi:hypothetical protein